MLEVAITRGMKHGQKVTFRGEADEVPGVLPGDVIFVIQVRTVLLSYKFGVMLVLGGWYG